MPLKSFKTSTQLSGAQLGSREGDPERMDDLNTAQVAVGAVSLISLFGMNLARSAHPRT
jgi:hypothetical protein